MSPGLARLAVPVLAVVGFAAMLGWYGWRLYRPEPPKPPPAVAEQVAPAAPATAPQQVPAPSAPTAQLSEKTPGPAAKPETAPNPAPDKRSPAPTPPVTSGASASAQPDPSKTATPSAPDKKNDKAPIVPSFDVVRVEPTGESVIAGRAAPGATVDLLSNGSNLARAVADPSGLFAFLPPKLAAGSHEISLQTIAPDGTRSRSAQSVTVVVPQKHDTPPLVAVTTPGQPTVVLSHPEEPAAPANGAIASAAPRPDAAPTHPSAAPAGTSSKQAAAVPGQPVLSAPPNPSARPDQPPPRAGVRIATVEAEGNGRLFVSGSAAPGATLRLYLNDSFVAPGGTGPQGQVSFTIERGIRPGDYKVRLDDVDPVSGAVRSRAEVPFNVPAPAAVAAAEPVPAPAAATPAPAAAVPAAPSSPVQSAAPANQPPVAAGNSPEPAGQAIPPAPRRSSVARAFPPAPSEGSTGASPSPAQPGTTSGPAPSSATPPQIASRTQEGPGFASRQTDNGAVVVPEITTTIVSRGDNLWQISKRTYGRGIRYTVIYGANQPQIQDPSLIYPGQVFVLPPGESQAAR